jgi:hypothetical protein
MGIATRVLFWSALPATIIGAPAAFAWLALEKEPLVVRSAAPSAEDVRLSEAFWQRYDPRRIGVNHQATVISTEAQINDAMRAGLAGEGKIPSRVAIQAQGLFIAATAAVPMPIGKRKRYANVRAVFAPSPSGLKISRLQIGRLRMPPSLSLPIFQAFVEVYAGTGRGAEVVESIRSVSVQGKSISVAFRPQGAAATITKEAASKAAPKAAKQATGKPVQLTARNTAPSEGEAQPAASLKSMPHGDAAEKTAAAQKVLTDNHDSVRTYYTRLIELARRQGSNARTSLTAFVQPLFRLASERSKTRNPIEENKAAILALSLYFGDQRIERIAADALKPDMRRKKRHTDHVKLDGRQEFVRHFVVSAGLTIAGGAVLADAMGDENKGTVPAGDDSFSFTDLAADRAGVRFARAAVSSRDNAVRFQSRLSDLITEADIFPAVRDLPEGLSEIEFKRRYGTTSSRAYNRLIAEIDRRIGNISLYR